MRSRDEMASFDAEAGKRLGGSNTRAAYESAMYAGCIPEMHWFVRRKDVKHNREPFTTTVCAYTTRLRRAYRHGYSLLFLGDNGTGKTMFASYVLGRAAHRGFQVYYTTLAQMDDDIKTGFSDAAFAGQLRSHLRAEFLVIDELGKEHYRKDSWLNTQLEGLLKQRYDDGLPTILAANLDYDPMLEMYGPTIASMLEGRYQQVKLEGGDYRAKSSTAMRREMGYP